MVAFYSQSTRFRSVYCFSLVLFFFQLSVHSFAQEEQVVEPYVRNLNVSAISDNDVFKALLSTLNDFRYFIDSIDIQKGTIEASLIDYSELVAGDMWSGTDHLSNMSQEIAAKFTALSNGRYNVELRITFLTKLVDEPEPYDVFLNHFQSSKYLTE